MNAAEQAGPGVLGTWVALALFVLVFTRWGRRLVLIPVGRVLIPLRWKDKRLCMLWQGAKVRTVRA